jgi:hypothetical protein
MKSRSRTIITRVIVFLLLGAIVNVAVAWGCVFSPFVMHVTEDDAYDWPVEVPAGFPRSILGWRVECFGKSFLGSVNSDGWIMKEMQARLYGLPCLTLCTSRFGSIDMQSSQFPFTPGPMRFSEPRTFWEGVVIPDWFAQHDEYFPTLPIWPGFAINTIFYAAVLALLFYGPGKVRRFVRVRKWRCPACAYPIGTSPVCTECGFPLTLQSSN